MEVHLLVELTTCLCVRT